MKIAFNPSTVAALTAPPNNKDITFDLRGRNIFARGVKFYGTDTNTWRDIKINNVSIGSHTLDLRNGSNTTLTNTNGVVTINSTWRPVVDNLTSDSTTSSLSAKQGKVLKSLIDGKSNSGHTHDDRYLKLTGGTMAGTINRRSGGSTISGRDHAIIRQTYAPGGSSWNPIACVDTETGTWTLGHLSSGSSDTNFHFCFSTNADYNAGNNAGNYVTLRNRVGTIALTSEIPSKGSWNYDDRYLKLTGGTMQLGEGLKFHADNNYFGTNSDARIISLLDNNDKVCDGGLIIDERGTLNGKEYVTELLRIRDSEFKWKGNNILHSGNSHINGNTITINGSSLTVSKSDHTHDYLIVNRASESTLNSAYHNFQVLFAGGSNGLSGKPSGVDAFGLIRLRAADGYSGQMLLANSGSLYIRSGSDSSLNNKLAWRQIIDSTTIGSQIVKGAYMTPLTLDIATLISSGYLASDYTNRYNIEEYMKAAAKYLQKNYSGQSVFGTMVPNSQGFFIANIYRNGFNSNGYPEHITIHYYPHGGDTINCGTTYGSWYYHVISRNGSSYKLQIARKIWGQSFDGTADISGTLSGVANIQFSANNVYDIGSNSAASRYIYTHWLGARTGQKLELGANNSDYGQGLCLDTNLNVGIGTNTPSYKLDVRGDIGTVGNIYIRHSASNNMNYNISNPRIVFSENGNQAVGLVYTDWDSYRASKGLKVMDVDNSDAGNVWLEVQGYNYSSGYVKNGSSNSYVLLGGGDHKAENSLNVASADKTRALKYTGTGSSEITAHQTDASYMGRSGWASYIICNHGNGSTYYSQTIAMPFWGSPIYRRLEGGTDKGWKKFYTEEAPPSWNNITNKPSSFTPAAHTHTWTSITDKIVFGNEFNIVNAGFKKSMWFNYLPINDRSKTATISGYHFGNGAKGYTLIVASGFIKKGSSSSYVLLGDGGHKTESSLNVANADTVDGFHATSNNNKPWGTIPVINTSGYMDIGKHLEFHYDNTTGSDYSTALMCQGNYSNIVYLPSASGTLALTSQVLTWKSQIIDMRNYSGSYWHPVTVPLSHTGYNKIKVSVQLNSGDKPSWATHSSGITCNMEIWATARGWGTTGAETICLNYTYAYCSQNPCGWMQLGMPSLGVLFLRGGSRYRVYTDFDATFTPHDQKYTWTHGSYSQNTGGPYTNCPGLTFSKNKIYANLDGYASRLEGGSIPNWGTLTAANGFTNVSSYDYGSNGAYGLCGKNSALYMQLDGYFYQNEGRYRVLDTSDLSSVTNHIMVSQYTTGDTNYPLVWSNQSNTSSAVGNQLYKSWADLYYNPKNKRLHTNRYVGSYANLTQTSMRHIDADLNSKNTDHTLYIGFGAQTYTAGTNIYASTGSGDTTNARYLLAQFNTSAGINLDSNINARPSIIFRNEASYKTTLSYATAGNEALCFETKTSITSIIFYNGATYSNSSSHWYDLINGVQIKNNCLAIGAGWANGVNPDYKLKVGGNSYFAGHLIANNAPSSWLDGQRYNQAGYNLQDVSGTGVYYPWMRQTNTGSAKWFSIGILNNSFYILGSKTSRTENSYDYAWRFDLSNGWAYGNFSNADTVDGVHLEWSGSLTYDQYSYLAAWTNDGKKIKAINKSQFASSGHTHSNYVTALGTSGNYLTWVKNGSTNNITVPYATSAGSAVSATKASYVTLTYCRDDSSPSNKGLWNTIKNGTSSAQTNKVNFYTIYNSAGGPSGHGEMMEILSYNANHWQPQLWFGAGKTGGIYYRNKSYNDNTWGSWQTVAFTSQLKDPVNYYWANVKVSASSSTGTSPTFSTAYTSSWFRSNGSTGWYSQTYGGGIYMTDTTWIRAYGNKGIVAKNFYASNWASATYLLRSDGGAAAFNWSGQSGQPTWLWGGNSQHSYYVYNPSNFKVAYATSAGSVAWANVTGRPSSLKNPYSLNVFGVAYDGSAAKTVTTSTFISQVSEATSTITDGTMLITSWASNNGFADTNAVNVPYKRKAVHLWDYIDGKVSTKYLPLAGGTMNANARISHGNGNLYIGRADNNGWVYTQDIASHAGTDKWSIKTSGAAHFGSIYIASKTDTSFNSNVIECTTKMYLNYFNGGDIILCNGGGKVGIGKSDPLYKLDVAGNGRFQDFVYCNAVYSNTLNHTSPTGHLIIGNKTKEISIRSSYLPDVPAVYLYQKFSTNVYYTANKGFGIRPYYLSSMDYRPTETISGNTYSVVTVGDSVQAISCIIADKANIVPQIRGTLIRFLPGDDGQIVLLKDLNNYGSINGYFYVQPKGCNIIGANNSNIYIADGNISDTYDDGKSRFFIYAKTHKVWIEFYCG